jgi:hypothetical protein
MRGDVPGLFRILPRDERIGTAAKGLVDPTTCNQETISEEDTTRFCLRFALSGAAFAQSQPAPGASSEGNVGTGAGTTTPHTKHMKSGTTTGMGTAAKKPGMSNPSSEGNVGPRYQQHGQAAGRSPH